MAKTKSELRRALSLSDILRFRPTTLDFDGEFEMLIGRPELTGAWLIWGNSSNGKTRFALQLARYMCRFCKVAYDSLEEGLSLSMQEAIRDVGFADCKKRFTLLDKCGIEELKERLSRHASPKVVFIDSLQYTGMNYRDYIELRDRFRNKLFVLISHAAGTDPKGDVAISIKYDAFVKIRVDNFIAYAMSRYGGGRPYTVWQRDNE